MNEKKAMRIDHRAPGTPVLLEITIVVLFFALSATVVLSVYMDAYRMSRRSDALRYVTYAAQNLTERVSGARAPDEYLTSVGFEEAPDGTWCKTDQSTVLTVRLNARAAAAGVLWQGKVTAAQSDEVAELPISWYVPGEGDA